MNDSFNQTQRSSIACNPHFTFFLKPNKVFSVWVGSCSPSNHFSPSCRSEISKAQDRLTDLLESIYASHPQYRELLRMIMSTVGRGGEGDVGQRIRDEILVIQVIELD